MTWSKDVTIWCDGCDKWARPGMRRVGPARDHLREIGWDCGTDKDLCPSCSEGP